MMIHLATYVEYILHMINNSGHGFVLFMKPKECQTNCMHEYYV